MSLPFFNSLYEVTQEQFVTFEGRLISRGGKFQEIDVVHPHDVIGVSLDLDEIVDVPVFASVGVGHQTVVFDLSPPYFSWAWIFFIASALVASTAI